MNTARKLGPTDDDLVSGYQHIVIRSGYLGGKPALKERRISVSQILESLAGGMTFQELWDSYNVSEEAIVEVLRYAAELAEAKQCG